MAHQSAYTPNANTRLYYKMNGGATDDSGLGNNGTPTNVSFPDGRFGQGGSFNGTNSYITVPDATSIRLTSSYTIGTWLNMSALPTSGNLYNLWYKFTPTTSLNGYECLLYNNAGTQQILLTHTAFPAMGVTSSFNYTLPTNRFIFFCVVYGSGTIKFYLDGTQINSQSITAPGADTGALEFGRNTNINSRFYSGLMDEIIVEGVALTADQVLQYYLNSKDAVGKGDLSFVPTSSTKLYLPLNTNVIDASGNNLISTPTNISWVNGRNAQAASFNGTSSYVQLPNNSTLKPSSSAPKTIYMWFKNSTTYAPYGVLWNGGYDVGNASNSSGFIALTNGNIIRLTGNGTDIVDASFNHNDNILHSLVCVMRSTGAKIYIDGTLRASGNLTFNAGVSTREPTLGAFLYGTSTPSNFLNGLEDEFFVLDGESTAKEIQQYYSNAIGRYQTNIT